MNEDGLYRDDHQPLSGADKIDWRLVIQRQMERCVRAKGMMIYPTEVSRLIACMNSNFYGIDFATPIKEKFEALDVETQKEIDRIYRTLGRSEYFRMGQLPKLRLKVDQAYWEEMFDFCRDILAKKRGLMWGKRSIGHGIALQDEE